MNTEILNDIRTLMDTRDFLDGDIKVMPVISMNEVAYDCYRYNQIVRRWISAGTPVPLTGPDVYSLLKQKNYRQRLSPLDEEAFSFIPSWYYRMITPPWESRNRWLVYLYEQKIKSSQRTNTVYLGVTTDLQELKQHLPYLESEIELSVYPLIMAQLTLTHSREEMQEWIQRQLEKEPTQAEYRKELYAYLMTLLRNLTLLEKM